MNRIGLMLALGAAVAAAGCEGGRVAAVGAERAGEAPRAQEPPGQWQVGDMHVHDDHSSDGSGPRQAFDQRGPANVSVADQIGQGVRAGLDWMPLTDHRTYTQHYDPLWESADLLLIPGEEANGSPHANVLGGVDTIVQGGVPEGRPEWSRLQTSIWDAHAQGAVWSHNHPDDGQMNDDDTVNERANAIGADTVEIWNRGSGIERELHYAEHQWNAGFRLAGVASSDNHFRELWAIAGPGTAATQVFAADLTERAVLQGLKAGHVTLQTRANLAPRVTLQGDFDGVDGFEVLGGDEVVAPAGREGTLRITVADGIGTTASLYRSPGRSDGAWQSFSITALEQVIDVPVTTADADDWFYVEVRGPGEIDSADTNALDNPAVLVTADRGVNERRAITAPIFVGPRLAQPRPEQPLPVAQNRPDGARLLLGEAGAFAGFPDVAVAGGVTHVVAEVHEPGATRVVYRRDGGEPVDLAPGSRSARFPKVAAQGQDVWVAWQDERAGQIPRRPAIYLRHSADGGATWSGERFFSTGTRSEKPDLALLPDGQPVVVWQAISADSAFDVYARVGTDGEAVNLSAAGKTIQAYDGIDTRSALYPASVWPRVAVSATGAIAVVFQDNREDPDPLWTGSFINGEDVGTEVDDFQIAVVIRAADGGDWSAPQLIGSPERFDAHPDAAFARDGALVVAWDSKEQHSSGANLSIRYAVSQDGGASFAQADEPAAVAEAPQYMSQYPRLGVAPNGRVRAVWYDNRHADWRWKVMSAEFDGRGWDAPRLLDGPGINTWPATAGNAIVFASTRNTRRLQRDQTQQVFVVPAR